MSYPARAAKEWRHGFLDDPPEKWNAGKLVGQAHAAGPFTAADRALADTLLDHRNRIHAGRFYSDDRFNPPFTNAHEAEQARHILDVLLDRLLCWHVVAGA